MAAAPNRGELERQRDEIADLVGTQGERRADRRLAGRRGRFAGLERRQVGDDEARRGGS